MKPFTYKVTFENGLYYMSPDIRRKDPGWGSEEFNHPIGCIEFFLSNNNFLLLSGMIDYNFFVEVSQSLSGQNARIESFYFLGKQIHKNKVHVWQIKNGTIQYSIEDFGKEYNGTPTIGWKIGSSKTKLVSKIMRR